MERGYRGWNSLGMAVAHLTIFSHVALHFITLIYFLYLDSLTRCNVMCESAGIHCRAVEQA
jgi:hypothetical protein